MRTMNSDQRREKRAPVDLMLNKYINGEPHLCRAVNLSRGGMLLRKIFEPELSHHRVLLEFQLPGSERVLRAEGMALLGSPGGRSCGVRFTHMSSETFQVLEQFLGHSAPGPTPRHAVH